MNSPANHTFGVQFDTDKNFTQWTFNDQIDPGLCKVMPGDTITFNFKSISPSLLAPAFVGGILMSDPYQPIVDHVPFIEGNIVTMQQDIVLTVAKEKGRYPFGILFAVRVQNDPVSFRTVPDPELQVGSTH